MSSCPCLSFESILLWAIGYDLNERPYPGDITRVSRVARMLAVMEGITGMFCVAMLVARLVSIRTAKFLASK